MVLIVRGNLSIRKVHSQCMKSKRKHSNLVLLGKRIREIRESKGYSQEGFAAEANIDRSYMGGIERGERNIAVLNLIKIAKVLEVEVGELFPPTRNFN